MKEYVVIVWKHLGGRKLADDVLYESKEAALVEIRDRWIVDEKHFEFKTMRVKGESK